MGNKDLRNNGLDKTEVFFSTTDGRQNNGLTKMSLS